MHDQYLTDEQARLWESVSNSIRTASDALSQAAVDALLKLNDANVDIEIIKAVMSRIEAAEHSMSGMAYLCWPQPEWTGNDEHGNYMGRTREPHVCSSVRRGWFKNGVLS